MIVNPAFNWLCRAWAVPEDFGGTDPEKGQCPLLARARSWVSRTPFLPTRHPKATRAGVPKVDATGFQIGSPEHELLRLLELAGFPEPEAVEPVASTRPGRAGGAVAGVPAQKGDGRAKARSTVSGLAGERLPVR